MIKNLNIFFNISIKPKDQADYLFRGTIKNKSELVKVLQMIGILRDVEST